MIPPVKTQGTVNKISVNPTSYTAKFADFFHPDDTGNPYRGEFTVEINISANDITGFEYGLTWNNTLLNVKKIFITPPWDNYTIDTNETADLGDGRSEHFLHVSAFPPSSLFNGNTTICRYTFQVKHQPYYPEPNGYCKLRIENAKFFDSSQKEIPLDPDQCKSGNFTIESEKIPIISLTPINWTSGIGSIVNVDIMIINVTSHPNYFKAMPGVSGFDLMLLYNKTCLNAINVTLPPGHFLQPSLDPSNIFIAKLEINKTYNETHGLIHVVATLLDPEPPRNGSGVLARVTFNLTAQKCISPLSFYTKPQGFPFPVKLAFAMYRGQLKSYVVPCTLGIGKAKLGEGSYGSPTFQFSYIIISVATAILVGAVAVKQYKKVREHRREDREYGWLLEE